MLKIIAAIGNNYELGSGGALPLWKLSTDFERFKNLTLGHAVVMGERTYFSLPEKVRPLPGRKNIVLSMDKNLKIDGVTIYNSSDELLQGTKNLEQVWIMGGGQIYKQFLYLADELHITHVDGEFTADTYFPYIDTDLWIEKHSEHVPKNQDNSHPSTYKIYKKI